MKGWEGAAETSRAGKITHFDGIKMSVFPSPISMEIAHLWRANGRKKRGFLSLCAACGVCQNDGGRLIRSKTPVLGWQFLGTDQGLEKAKGTGKLRFSFFSFWFGRCNNLLKCNNTREFFEKSSQNS